MVTVPSPLQSPQHCVLPDVLVAEGVAIGVGVHVLQAPVAPLQLALATIVKHDPIAGPQANPLCWQQLFGLMVGVLPGVFVGVGDGVAGTELNS